MGKKIKINKPGNAKLWFIIPDLHFPEQDQEAVEVMLAAHRELNPDYTLLLGDVIDCGLFSMHPRRYFIENSAYDFHNLEIDPCNTFIDQLQVNTKTHTYYLEGNHEQRIERWAVANGRIGESIYDLISPRSTIAKHRENFTMIPYSPPTGDRRGFVQISKATIKRPGLVAVHGWSVAKHAASVHLEKSRSQSVVHGHTHRQELVASRDPWTGQIIKAFCPGTLSKLQPIYMVGGAPSSWSHGFGIVYVGNESWTEYLISIVNGRCVLPTGKEIRLV